MGRARAYVGAEVVVHVYDLVPANDILYPIGLGAYHTGVMINGQEWSFGGSADAAPQSSGVYSAEPKQAPGAQFRTAISFGSTSCTIREMDSIISRLGQEYLASEYDLIRRNCNCFSDDLVYELTGNRLPGWINRMAGCGRICSCFFPKESSSESVPIKANFVAFQGDGYSMAKSVKSGDAPAHNRDEVRERMAKAALARMALLDSDSGMQ